MRDHPHLAGLLLLLLALAAGGCGAGPEDAPRPNVVVITIDTLRPDHLGFAGASRDTAPFLAELAATGTVFDRAFSTSSWTAPATASLFTGLYPQRHGVVRGFFAQFQQEGGATEQLELHPLPRDRRTLPEVFHEAGYATFGLATNLNICREFGFDRGFDRFENLGDVPAGEVFARLAAWKEELAAEQPWFLYLHLNDVHWPYEEHAPWYVPGPDLRSRRASAYDSEISALDAALRRFFVDQALGDETLVAVVSDHGEEFREHERWFHGFSLYRELTQVLFLLHAPALGVPARRVEANVGLVDVLPTLAELAGVEGAPAGNGRSLVPLLREPEEADPFAAQLAERPLYAHRLNQGRDLREELWAVTKGSWKLIEYVDAQGTSRRALFDLDHDRLDQHPLAPEARPEVAAELGALLDEYVARGTDVHGAAATIELDPELRRKLEALGYAGDHHDGK